MLRAFSVRAQGSFSAFVMLLFTAAVLWTDGKKNFFRICKLLELTVSIEQSIKPTTIQVKFSTGIKGKLREYEPGVARGIGFLKTLTNLNSNISKVITLS